MNFFALQLLFFAFAYLTFHIFAFAVHLPALPSSAIATPISASPCLCKAPHLWAELCLRKAVQNCPPPLHIKALPYISSPFSAVAGYHIAAQRLGCSSPFPAMPLPRPASLGNAVAKHIASIRSYAIAAQVMSMLCRCFTLPCNSFAPRLKAVP